MLKIIKNAEPKEWVEYRNTPGVDYQSIPALVHSLLEEQGYICAYCMRRIPVKDRKYKKDGVTYVMTEEDHRVEHMLSRENHPNRKLIYRNMVICCPGHIGAEDHCDRLKGSNDISFNLFEDSFIDTLSYKSDGEICSSNPQYDKEINEILNLNTPLLKANRKESWNAVRNELIAAKGKSPWNKSFINLYIKKYSSLSLKDGKKQYIQYCGITLYFLKKRLKQL